MRAQTRIPIPVIATGCHARKRPPTGRGRPRLIPPMTRVTSNSATPILHLLPPRLFDVLCELSFF